MTREEFLRRWPWPPEWTDRPRLDWLWTWELPAGARELWPALSDTSSFNKRLGLKPIAYTEKQGRLHGVQDAGLRLEWVEAPWEWEYARGLSNSRTYSKGFAEFVRARYVLEELGSERSRVTVYFGWVPRGLGGRLILAASERWMRGRFDAVLGELAAVARAAAAPPPPAPPALAPAAAARLKESEAALLAAGCEPKAVSALLRHLAEAPDDALVRVKPRPLARQLGLELRPLLKTVLHATRAGALLLSWDVVCPHCRGVRRAVNTLGDVPAKGECEPCGVRFAATGLEALEATFRVHPAIRVAEPRMFCAAEPATKPHIVLQRVVPPRAELELETLLPAGAYRLRAKGRDSGELLELAERARVRLRNGEGEPRTFTLERDQRDGDALRPADLFVLQEFRDLFPDESVGEDIQLEIGVQTILFTDLVGSTRFYEQVGDAEAFARVRGHFIRIFDAVRRHDGAVVKTIGDAALGAFPRASDALAAAVELQRYFNASTRGMDLRIRISLHTGRCLAVKLNSGIDYFGSTVNLAAKLQAVVEAQQVVFTDAVLEDAQARAFVAGLPERPQTVDFPMKWSGGRMSVQRLTL